MLSVDVQYHYKVTKYKLPKTFVSAVGFGLDLERFVTFE